ncbi:MAG: sigma-54 dependent transcriptional regulator [Nitrospira sp.]|nr:sigma-54 dependent transcriptional regulator [Nitrospira sp.]
MKRYKVLAGMLALKDEFTIADLARFSGVSYRTVSTVVSFSSDVVETRGYKETGRQGGKLIVYRVRPNRIERLRNMLSKQFENINRSPGMETAQSVYQGVPLGLLAAEDALLRLPRNADSKQEAHLLQIVDIGLREANDCLQTEKMTAEFEAKLKNHVNFVTTLRDHSGADSSDWCQDYRKFMDIATTFSKFGESKYSVLALRKAAEIESLHTHTICIPSDRLIQTSQDPLDEICGTSPAMWEVFKLIRKVATTDMPVLLTGETGTGKELTAQAIHVRSLRKDGPFVPFNCGAIPEMLLESELFGHERGAFSGAVSQKKGKVEAADGGTLFLDEVGDLLPALQVKLLRFLQDGTFVRVGGQETIRVDARVIAATNVDLKAAIVQNKFREDLYYRLDVLHIHLPPLRERDEDTLLMAMVFLRRAAAACGKHISSYTVEAVDAMRAYSWPGNVRELSNRVRRAVVTAEGDEIRPQDLDLVGTGCQASDSLDSLRADRRRNEVAMLVRAISLHHGNLTRVARDLEVSRSTLYRKLRAYGLENLLPTGIRLPGKETFQEEKVL